ncbi:ankyrin repeat-containing protein [Tanacetum coccineum]|uniref:Ankyrin repeat-containing protein n=1 Tax=Tanacetum coccineum TaxID=301880 RepID=A0ABQ4ZNG3_9ASTR
MANNKIEGLETESSKAPKRLKGFRSRLETRFAAMQQESKARQEETTKRFDDVMKASAALTSKIQPENEKKNTGPQYHDLGFLMNTRNLNGSLDPKKKRVEGVVFQDKNNEFEVGSGSNGIGNRRGSFGAHFRFRKLNMPIFEGEDAHGWIYRMERYFDIQEIQEIDQLSWEGLKRRLLERFQQSYEGTLHEQFLGITQDGTARDYVALFKRLACQLVGVPEPVLEGTFFNGLKPELRACVHVMQPEGLHHAMKLSVSIDENKTCNNVLRGELKDCVIGGDKKVAPDHRCPSQTLQVLLVDESDGSDAEAAPELEVNDGMQEQRSIKRKF